MRHHKKYLISGILSFFHSFFCLSFELELGKEAGCLEFVGNDFENASFARTPNVLKPEGITI